LAGIKSDAFGVVANRVNESLKIPPSPEDMGHCDDIYIDEVGDVPVILFKQNKGESEISTIVVRGSTDNIMDDIERSIDDGVNNFKALTKVGYRLKSLVLLLLLNGSTF
jgi:chaperonin GroEL (HSP60 family)